MTDTWEMTVWTAANTMLRHPDKISDGLEAELEEEEPGRAEEAEGAEPEGEDTEGADTEGADTEGADGLASGGARPDGLGEAGGVDGVDGTGASCVQAAMTTRLPAGSALPPTPPRSTK